MPSDEEIARRVVSRVGTGSILLSSGRYRTSADVESDRIKLKDAKWTISHLK